VCTVALDVPEGGCDNPKRGVMEFWSDGLMGSRPKPLLHRSPLGHGQKLLPDL
jgi:hypothetical protein